MIACCYEGCGGTVCFTDEIEERLRRTHEFWMCPFGHRQHFSRKTPQEAAWEVERAQLERIVAIWRARADDWEVEFGTCPFGCGWRTRSGCDRRWLQMLKHFSKAHGNMLPSRMVWACRSENRSESA